ncbi:hypothetical protein EIN_253240 [Entamoeba invadens IP1]|uniref:Oxidation resistance protein 1 n=1 Tax=Entamoeba invadens IP1 TaxID=370355 RepID=A0A0A1UES0_ENTIV|nr:hypothetical protein EIN_253240 [Entamoeba invadens IP1]ELP95060.1 hypothetical protein EIN_253240 [Entamoeba invadens IP1]|eukprot:XP_004261831.1 hypothetical protein EIN_253240 [Entamoeba invadens IP1]
MESQRFLNPFSSRTHIFLLNFQELDNTIQKIEAQMVYSQPYPTPLELMSVTPLSKVQLKHISFVLAKYENVHLALLQLVPSVFQEESHFWARYFKLLFVLSKREKDFQKFIHTRIVEDPTPQLQHVFYLKRFLLNTENNWGRIPTTSGIPFLATASNCYEVLLRDNSLTSTLINLFIKDGEKPDKLRHGLLSKNANENVEYRICDFMHTLYETFYVDLSFVQPLVSTLLEVYDFERTYLICQSFLLRMLYLGIYPLDCIQFDCLMLTLNSVLEENFPCFVKNLNDHGVDVSTMFEDILNSLCLPLAKNINLDNKMLLLGSLLIYGYPLVINVIINTLRFCDSFPMPDNTVFIDAFTNNFEKIIQRSWCNELPQHLQFHYFISINPKFKYHSFFDTPVSFYHLQCVSPSVLPNDMLSVDQASTLNMFLPTRIAFTDLEVIYSSTTDGFSLRNLYYKCVARYPLVVLIKAEGKIFGGYVPDELSICSKYRSTGETFLFSLTDKVKYSSTSNNNYFLLTDASKFSFGGGNGVSSLSLDRDLYGVNYRTPTYNNEPFLKCSTFIPSRVEVWSCTFPSSVPSSGVSSVSTSVSSSARTSIDMESY